jgi:hypothetical protein
MTVPPDVVDYVAAVADVVPDAVGVYLHGSAVLGGFRPERSDVDVLIVVRAAADAPAQRAMGAALAAVPGCPGVGLELSVIAADAADDLAFEVHVNTTGARPRVVIGAGHSGDPDLVLHRAVCRAHGFAVTGPPPADVLAPIDARRIVAALRVELAWAREHASGAYAVLNACRALRFVHDGRLCSKVDGGEWYLAHHGDSAPVRAALAAQRADGPQPTGAGAFVETVLSEGLPAGPDDAR